LPFTKKRDQFRKILVIQTASIGDVILATPVIEHLHQEYPEASIDFLLKKGIEGIFEGHPFLNEVIAWDKSQNKYHNYYKIHRKVRRRKYDAVVNIQRFFATGLITAFSGAAIKAGFDKNPLSWAYTHKTRHILGSKEHPIHETERNLTLIREFSGERKAGVRLYPSESDCTAVAEWASGKYITIAPASLWFTKQFPEAKWLEFITALDSTIKIYLLGSKTDVALCERLINNSAREGVVNLAGKLRFLQSAALMKNALMNYVNDSAPMHLASAVNAPVAAIYCSTVPAFGFGPVSGKSVIIEIQENLPCRPCGLHGKTACPEKHFKCAKGIKVKQLLKALEVIGNR
jgi:heptosyltransferase-2